jgi:hypothetical protein
MARAFDPDNLNKKIDEAWLGNLALIRELTLQEKQAEDDRAFAASLAGVTLDKVPDNLRRRAMLTDDFDDDSDDENEKTSMFTLF